ncbi:MAG: OmpA family protein [Geminicoccaceae bacterium]
MIAVGISSLANAKVDAFDIDINWVSLRDDPLEVMGQDDSDLGLVNLAEVDPDELNATDDLRAVMKAWQVLAHSGKTDGDSDRGYLLVAKTSIDAALIENFVAAVQSDSIILNAANLDTERLAPSVAMIDLPLRLHEGAQDYLTTSDVQPAAPSTIEPEITESAGDPAEQEVVISRVAQDGAKSLADSDVKRTHSDIDQPGQTPLPGQISGSRSYILYFDTDEATIDKGHITSVARACRYATKLPRAKFVISGHTDTAGSTSYNDDLAKRRASVVADTIRNDPRFREALSVVEFGETNPALKTRDGVSEPMNRRVVVTILPD